MDVLHHRFGIAKYVPIDALENIGLCPRGAVTGHPISIVNMTVAKGLCLPGRTVQSELAGNPDDRFGHGRLRIETLFAPIASPFTTTSRDTRLARSERERFQPLGLYPRDK